MNIKNLFILFLLFIFIGGCSSKDKKTVLLWVNNYDITKEEFEQEFKESAFGKVDNVESRKDFLNNLINRKLILQEAQAKGLDKEKGFLKTIEKFWEQSLLKIALEKKSQEIAGSVQVSDDEIEKKYQAMLSEGKTDKLYQAMYQEIKWQITKDKESQKMNEWLEGLRKKAKIKEAK